MGCNQSSRFYLQRRFSNTAVEVRTRARVTPPDTEPLYDYISMLDNKSQVKREPSVYFQGYTVVPHDDVIKWNISALLALCVGNSPVTDEFPSRRPMTRSFDVFFDLRLNKRLSKQSWDWWFETPSRSLWRHCHVNENSIDKIIGENYACFERNFGNFPNYYW